MDHIWSPWRYRYIASAERKNSCIFCEIRLGQDDVSNLVLYRGELIFVVLNLFPYTSGHLMIVPNQHTASFAGLDQETTRDMFQLAKRAEVALRQEYNPDGFNIGMNLGKAAGAGIEEHLHLHIVPRWVGDANFVSTIGETRVLPEELSATLHRLKPYFN